MGVRLPQAAADVLAQFEDPRVGDEVEHVRTVPAPAQDPGLAQRLQVSRCIGLRQPAHGHQFGHVLLTVLQCMDEFEPTGFPEHPEPGGDQIQGRILGQRQA